MALPRPCSSRMVIVRLPRQAVRQRQHVSSSVGSPAAIMSAHHHRIVWLASLDSLQRGGDNGNRQALDPHIPVDQSTKRANQCYNTPLGVIQVILHGSQLTAGRDRQVSCGAETSPTGAHKFAEYAALTMPTPIFVGQRTSARPGVQSRELYLRVIAVTISLLKGCHECRQCHADFRPFGGRYTDQGH
jgi:hypothetical protein